MNHEGPTVSLCLSTGSGKRWFFLVPEDWKDIFAEYAYHCEKPFEDVLTHMVIETCLHIINHFENCPATNPIVLSKLGWQKMSGEFGDETREFGDETAEQSFEEGS